MSSNYFNLFPSSCSLFVSFFFCSDAVQLNITIIAIVMHATQLVKHAKDQRKMIVWHAPHLCYCKVTNVSAPVTKDSIWRLVYVLNACIPAPNVYRV